MYKKMLGYRTLLNKFFMTVGNLPPLKFMSLSSLVSPKEMCLPPLQVAYASVSQKLQRLHISKLWKQEE